MFASSSDQEFKSGRPHHETDDDEKRLSYEGSNYDARTIGLGVEPEAPASAIRPRAIPVGERLLDEDGGDIPPSISFGACGGVPRVFPSFSPIWGVSLCRYLCYLFVWALGLLPSVCREGSVMRPTVLHLLPHALQRMICEPLS